MKEELKLCSVLNHDTESIQQKPRRKISQAERKKRGDFIAEKSKDGVKKILENIHRKEISLLDRLRVKNWK